jgi:hypothetical protein
MDRAKSAATMTTNTADLTPTPHEYATIDQTEGHCSPQRAQGTTLFERLLRPNGGTLQPATRSRYDALRTVAVTELLYSPSFPFPSHVSSSWLFSLAASAKSKRFVSGASFDDNQVEPGRERTSPAGGFQEPPKERAKQRRYVLQSIQGRLRRRR